MDSGYLNGSHASHRLPSPPTLGDDVLYFLRHFDDIVEANGRALDLADEFFFGKSSSDGAGSSSTTATMVAESPVDDVVPHEEEEEERAPANKCGPVLKGQWTPEEDRKLRELVRKYGTKKWSVVAKSLSGRIGKQCRERWHNHLRPDIKTDAWTEEEDLIVIQGHREHGNRWVEIAKRLPGRTENSIKNHWNTNMRRQTSRRARRKPAHSPSGTAIASAPAPGSTLLHDYIRSLNLPPSRSKQKRGRVPNPPPPASAVRNPNPGIKFGAPPPCPVAAAAANEGIYGIGCLFRGLGTGGEIAGAWEDAAVPKPPPAPVMVAAPGKEDDMDLVEMINMFYEGRGIGLGGHEDN